MEGKKVSPRIAGGMIMHLEVFPEEIHVLWTDVLDHKVGKPMTGSTNKKSNDSLGQLKSIYHVMWLRKTTNFWVVEMEIHMNNTKTKEKINLSHCSHF